MQPTLQDNLLPCGYWVFTALPSLLEEALWVFTGKGEVDKEGREGIQVHLLLISAWEWQLSHLPIAYWPDLITGRNKGEFIKPEAMATLSATTFFTIRIQTPWLLFCYLPAALSPTICHPLLWNTDNSPGVSWTITHPCLWHALPYDWTPSLYSSTWHPPMVLMSHSLRGRFFQGWWTFVTKSWGISLHFHEAIPLLFVTPTGGVWAQSLCHH